MTFENEEKVFDYIRKNLQVSQWVTEARKNSTTLRALVIGEDFDKVLITEIEKIESKDRAEARKKYSKDIRDLFHRVYQPRSSVFSAHGGSVHNTFKEGSTRERVLESLRDFKGQKSIHKYLSETFFKLEDTDPNGLMFVEYVGDNDIFPTYKSINDIRSYISNGQICEVLLFEPKTKSDGNTTWTEWRVVDDKKDYRVIQKDNTYILSEELTFDHPFGKVPAVILSDHQKTGSELRISPIFPVEELAKDYARDKSIKTIYKFQHGFPRHWRYVKECRACQGTGKTGEGICGACTGKGHIQKNDVTDIQTIPLPREDDQIITPNVEGFISPDLETWTQFNEDLKSAEELIDSTVWGTQRLNESSNETATGRFIDVQPVENALGIFTDNVEWVENFLILLVENWVNGQPKKVQELKVVYGRRYIIESPDSILERYTKSKNDGDNVTILDRLLDEYILSKHQNDPVSLERSQKKRTLEPYIHNSTKDVFDWFGTTEAEKKVLFPKFWEQADSTKDAAVLQTELDAYYIANTKIVIPPVPEIIPIQS